MGRVLYAAVEKGSCAVNVQLKSIFTNIEPTMVANISEGDSNYELVGTGE